MTAGRISKLTWDQRHELEQWVNRFEAAWTAGSRPAIEDFLPADSPLRQAVLVELLYADMEFRQTAGASLAPAQYLERFPELAEDPSLLQELPESLRHSLTARQASSSAENPGSTSETLLGRLQNPQDQAAWMRFVNLYTPLLYHWTKRVGLSQADGADLVQEVFAVLVQTMPEFRYDRQRSFRGWLQTVLLNKWRELHRRKKLPTVPGPAGDDLDQLPESTASLAFWEVDYQKFLVNRALELMKEGFQPTTWQACWGMVVEGKSAAEVSKALGMSVAAVYMAKSRVLRQLRQELQELWD